MVSESTQRTHTFALIVSGVPELSDQVLDALFEAGCDDATISMRHARLYVDFAREAPSLKLAILSAIRDVMRAEIGATVERVDVCDLVSQSDIAERLGVSRQMVYQYVRGERGPGGFPPPAYRLAKNNPVWQWRSVSGWLARASIISHDQDAEALLVFAINSTLERRAVPKNLLKEVESDLKQLGV